MEESMAKSWWIDDETVRIEWKDGRYIELSHPDMIDARGTDLGPDGQFPKEQNKLLRNVIEKAQEHLGL
jgi:hypothetical protein